MFVMNVKGGRLKFLGSIFFVLILITIFIVCVNQNLRNSTPDIRAQNYPPGETDAQRVEFLQGFGLETTGSPVDSREVTIPFEFDREYERYNGIQLDQGFDLSEFKGERAVRFTYEITNYPGYAEGVNHIKANLLISQGRIIGGDVSNTDVEDGFVRGFKL